MSILTVENLELSYGAFTVFSGISARISNDSKIGLIGPNGIGKTSLLLILAGFEQATAGSVQIARGRKVGYLPQEAMDAFADRKISPYEEMLSVFAGLREMQKKLNELEEEMASGNYTEQLLEDYGSLQTAFELAGGYDYEIRIKQTLDGLGLKEKDWHTPISKLSGGQKTRAMLARLLLEKPDLLMLDEPTNHLDIEAVEWLERTLREWDGAVLIVSHDRYFLDNTVNTIFEMSRTKIETYPGSYTDYLVQREERWAYYERVFEEEKARLLNEVEFIQKNWVRASTHARALGLLRRLSRDLAIVDAYGIMALRSGKQWSEMGLSADRPLDVVEAVRKVNSIQMSNGRPPRIRPRLQSTGTSGNIILQIPKATIGYPRLRLFEVRNLELRRGECTALIGPNGSGKTTFLKVLLGQLKPLAGTVHLGASLKIGYFAQVHDSLKGEWSVLDELMRHKNMLPGEARSYLAPYLFRGDDVFKPVEALSGGERARLALAILALEGANFLLLDEPTNHLDIPARESLQEVLINFTGTILLVSHDRFLIDQVATQIWDLRDGKLEVFRGKYHEFVLRKAVVKPSRRTEQTFLPHRRPVHAPSKEARKQIENMERLENRIREQERMIQKLSGELRRASESKAFEKTNQISWQLAKAEAALDTMMSEWEKAAV